MDQDMAAFVNNPLLFLLKCSLLTLIVVRGTSDSNSNQVECQSDHYFDMTERLCKKCSSCPSSHITINPCTKLANIQCLKNKFSQNKNAKAGSSDSGFKFNSANFDASSKRGRNQGGGSGSKRGVGDGNKSSPPVNNELNNEEDNYWKTLAFALIGLLSVLIITTFIILIFVFKKLQKSIVITPTEEADLMDDADSGYVVIRAIHHMAMPRPDGHPILSLHPRDQTTTTDGQSPPPPPPPPFLLTSGPTSIDSGRPADSFSMSTPGPVDDDNDNNDDDSKSCFLPKTYQPQRRLLNYDADDVFESDDNNTNSSVSHLHHHCHHHRLATDPKERLQQDV